MDVRRDLGETETKLKIAFDKRGLPFKVVLTKTDKISKTSCSERIAQFADALRIPPDDVLPISSLRGNGIRELWATLRSLAEDDLMLAEQDDEQRKTNSEVEGSASDIDTEDGDESNDSSEESH